MEKRIIKCDNLSESQINQIISDYEKCGWRFIGISEGFPPDYRWIHLEWSIDRPPIFPETEPNS